MEDLTKNQMVLLCLLVSFVTSIGTGIITASLLREVPQNVTQTINRVVERTVQTIGPETSNTNTVTREVTVVVKEEDLVIDSINKSRNSLVRIFKAERNGVPTIQTVGIVVKTDGTILADKRFVTDTGDYTAVFAGGGEAYPVKIVGTSQKTNAVFLSLVMKTPKTFTPAKINNSENPQLGQTVIAIGGKEKEAVAVGRINSVTQMDVNNAGNASTTKVAATIEIDTPLVDLIAGSVLLNLNGEMIGFENVESRDGRENIYTAIGAIKRDQPSFFE